MLVLLQLPQRTLFSILKLNTIYSKDSHSVFVTGIKV